MAQTLDLHAPIPVARHVAESDVPSGRRRLDPTRIAAETGALAVHGVALLLLLAPLAPPAPSEGKHAAPDVTWVQRVEPERPPPRPEEVELRRPRSTQAPAALPARPDPLPIAIEPVVAPEPGDIAIDLPVVADAITEPAGAGETIDGVHLEYVSAPPPPYPPQALRAQLTGTVLLRVWVDIEGRPVEVQVERSSGHRLLDAAARRQVLAKWRFRPAQRDGMAVPAIGRIPIEFTLAR